VLGAWRGAGGLVVHTREAHAPDLSDCPPAKRLRGNPSPAHRRCGPHGPHPGARRAGQPDHPALAPVAGEIVIDKPGKGAFYATPLHNLLQQAGVTHLLFMGVTTEVCVQTSMREANDRGYEGLLLEDCTESYFPHFKAAAVEMMRAQGAIVGWTAPSAALLQALR
jgi:nicotinamidase-related amidase